MARPRIAWSDLPGRRVGLYGLGVEGLASLRACHSLGIDPILVDDNPSAATGTGGTTVPPADIADVAAGPPLSSAGAVLATDAGGLEALASCEVVIKSPGISRNGATVNHLQAHGVSIVGGLGLWLAGADLSRVLVITGTKGKSTTTAIAGHLLSHFGYRCLVGGNIGQPPYDPEVGSDYDYWVLEVSSYQATDLPVSPPVTAVTSLHPDHLPWHRGDPEVYYRDKLSALNQPGADVTVANGDSAVMRDHADLLGPRVRWVHAQDDPDATWMQGLGLLGAHNRRNALIARESLRAMGIDQTADDELMAAATRGFTGLASRMRVVGHAGGMAFVDDNLSTNVLSTVAAVQAFGDRRVALLVGGKSRGIDYAPLAVGLRLRTVPLLMVTMPTNGPDIRRQVEQAGPGPAVTVADAESLDDAVRIAAAWARPDGVVLLSPAAPSFDLFRNYQERGAAFVTAVMACGGTLIDALPTGDRP